MHWHYRPVWLRSAPVREEQWFIPATLWKKRSSFTAFTKNRYSNTRYRPLYPWLCTSFFLSTHLYWPINVIGSVYFCFIGFEDDLSGRLGALSRSLLNWKTDRCWIKPLVCCFTLKHKSNVFVSYIVIYRWCFVFQSASWSWFIRPAGVFRIWRLTVTRFTCAASAGLDLSSSPLLIMSSYCGLYMDYNADTTLMLEFESLTSLILDCTSYSAVRVSFSV